MIDDMYDSVPFCESPDVLLPSYDSSVLFNLLRFLSAIFLHQIFLMIFVAKLERWIGLRFKI